jgi:phospholipase/lecithinase/hemolysin
MEVSETLRPAFVAYWIWNNDALAGVTSWDHLDASQLTAVGEFYASLVEIAFRLNAIGAKAVFSTIPDVSKIGFLLNGNDLRRFVGCDFGLPEGYRTSVITMLLIKGGLADPAVLQTSDFVLDTNEAVVVNDRIQAFNNIIKFVAATYGFGVADIAAKFDELATNPAVIAGCPITTKCVGGLFSLDGVHPSNTGHALSANEFIAAFNARYGTVIPQIDQSLLDFFALTDPFVDRDGDIKVAGRPGAGLLETVCLIFGISGDAETIVNVHTARIDSSIGARFVNEYTTIKGRDISRANTRAKGEALAGLFRLDRFSTKPKQ